VAFVRADEAQRVRAIGALDGVGAELGRALDAGCDFEPIPEPGPGDWLSVARERGQTFEQFTRAASNRPTEAAQHIYLRPVGDFPPRHRELLRHLQEFGSEFFVRDLRLLPPVPVEGGRIATRRNRFTDVVQLKTRDILPALAESIPPDAWCVLGVTAYDLYPHDTWSFVFGEALLGERVGVFSVARYDPEFYGKPVEDPLLLVRRSCKVLAHEACHMIGMRHCVFFNCLMNGSNHLAESDRRPLHLCPVDLRKLQWILGVDVTERYRRLLAFWREAGVDDEAAWIERRLESIERG
jgi:archaemetzincin